MKLTPPDNNHQTAEDLAENEIILIDGTEYELSEIISAICKEHLEEAVFNVFTGGDKNAVRDLIEAKIDEIYECNELIKEDE